MEIQSMHIKLPRGSKAFIFGSALGKAEPNDLDILIVYDSTVVAPERAYLRHKCFLDNIKGKTSLPTDITLLTRHEERQLKFIEQTGAKPIEEVLNS